MQRLPFVVLGTGMAGLGASYVLKSADVPFACYDKNDYLGGHTRSLRYENGFVFDEGGHISFTKNDHVQKLLAANVAGAFEERKLTIDNYWQGYRIPHPVQSNLRHLPAELIVQIIADFKLFCDRPNDGLSDARQQPDTSCQQTYAEWLHETYGATFATTFPMVYGRKYHTTSMEQLTTDWIGPRMYRPTLQELVRGALHGSSPATHYVGTYRYPSVGGFVSYLEPFGRDFDVRLNKRLVGLDPHAKVLQFEDGETISYGAVISSIPLPDLVPLIAGVPDSVCRASQKLAFTTAVLINLGIGRADFSETAITYFYDEDIIFSRINLPHLFSPLNAPNGCGCIQAEIYFSEKYKPFAGSAQGLIERTIADLRRCQLLRDDDPILLKDAIVNRYANIIYDLDRAAALRTVHNYLDEIKVLYCGRYGNWDHAWTDEAFVSGENTARAALGS